MKKLILGATLAMAASMSNAATVLVVLSDSDRLDLKDGKTLSTGFFLNELMQPVKVFIGEGHTVVFATPGGKAPTMDRKSDDVAYFDGSEQARKESRALMDTLKLTSKTGSPVITLKQVARIGYDKFDAVFVPGGHAPMQDLLKDRDLGALLRHFHAKSKVTGLTCHGTVALMATIPGARKYVAQLEQGQHLPPSASWIYAGYKMAAFTNEEEEQSKSFLEGGQMKLFPQDALVASGARFVAGKAWSNHVIEDRELISGQNPQSAVGVATAMAARLR